MRVLIFYTAALGLGHKRSAQAIEKALKKLYPYYEVITLNALKESTSNIEKIVSFIRYKAIITFPYILKFLYQYEEIILKVIRPLENIVYSYYKKKFSVIIKKLNPDVIVCTHAFPCTAISRLEKNIPLIYVVTDFDIMSYHLRTQADIILVPNEHIKNKMNKVYKNIYITGIPIDPEFSIKKSKRYLQNKYSIKNNPTLLILGGGSGLNYFYNIISYLNSSYQIITNVGNNNHLKTKLEKNFPDIKVFGYTENIDEIYRISDIAITKPGGLTSSELLSIKLPIIITNPLPGIEEKNSSFLISNNIAIKPNSLNELKKIINLLINDRKKMLQMKKNAFAFANPRSAFDVAKIINSSKKILNKK